MGNSRVIDAVRVRDQLGRPDDKALFGPFRLNERVRMTEGPSIALKRDVTNDVRWDVALWDEDNFQETHTNSFVVTSITNPNNNFVWRPYFDNTTKGDDYPLTRSLIGDNTTATIDYNVGEATFTAGQRLEIVSAYRDEVTNREVVNATLNVTADDGDFTYMLSADGGKTWGVVENGGTITFAQAGTLTGDNLVLNLYLERNPDGNRTVYDLSKETNDGEYRINATAYYPFNGNANDESVNSNNGVVVGATLTTDRFGNENNAYNMGNNSSNKIEISSISLNMSNSTNETFYISAKPQNATDNFPESFFTVGDSNNLFSFYYRQDNNTITLLTRKSGVNTFQNLKIENIDEVWSNLVLVKTGTQVKFFLNGVLENTITIDINTLPNVIQLGNSPTVTGRFRNGSIDEFMPLNIALSDAEVLNLYNVTKEHKLDKPLVTKTDSDGNSITGYETTIAGDSANIKPSLVTVDIPGSARKFKTGDHTYFLKILSQQIGGLARYYLSNYLMNIYIRSNGNLAWRVGRMNNSSGPAYNVEYTGTTINKIYQVMGICHPDAGGSGYIRFIVADAQGTILFDDTTSIGSNIPWVDYGSDFSATTRLFHSDHGTARGVYGVASKPIIIDRVLTENERNALFNNNLQTPLKGTDLHIKAIESAGTTGTITRITNKYNLN